MAHANHISKRKRLRRSIEAMFDISRHILSKSYEFKSLEYKDVALALGAKKIVFRGAIRQCL